VLTPPPLCLAYAIHPFVRVVVLHDCCIRVVSALVVCMVPDATAAGAAPGLDWHKYVRPLYEAVLNRLR
jgi:hypothetical protein